MAKVFSPDVPNRLGSFRRLRKVSSVAVATFVASLAFGASAQKPTSDSSSFDADREEIERACWQVHSDNRDACIEAGGPRALRERRRAEWRAAPYRPEGFTAEQQQYNGPARAPRGGSTYQPEGFTPEQQRYNGPSRSSSRDLRPHQPEGLPAEQQRYNGPTRSSRGGGSDNGPEGFTAEQQRYNGPSRSSRERRSYEPEGLPADQQRYNGPSPSSRYASPSEPEGFTPEQQRYLGSSPRSSEDRAGEGGIGQGSTSRSGRPCPGLTGAQRTVCLNAEVEQGRRRDAAIEARLRVLDRAQVTQCVARFGARIVGLAVPPVGLVFNGSVIVGDHALDNSHPCLRELLQGR